MLKPITTIRHFNSDPKHPHYDLETQARINDGELVVSLNDRPLQGQTILAFDVANGFINRIVTEEDFAYMKRHYDDNKIRRVSKHGLRMKGKVRVFEHGTNIQDG